jgi:4-diphosphocytidyl-2C-methyl-D-erythritol kinase
LVFKALDLSRCAIVSPEDILKLYLLKGATQGAAHGGLVNDLESPAFSCEPLLANIKNDIKAADTQLAGVMMSGSGLNHIST